MLNSSRLEHKSFYHRLTPKILIQLGTPLFLGLLYQTGVLKYALIIIFFYLYCILMIIMSFSNLLRRHFFNMVVCIFAFLISSYFAGLPIQYIAQARHRAVVIFDKLGSAYNEVIDYSSKHDGHLPSANDWCSELLLNNNALSEDDFQFEAYGRVVNMVMNESLNGFKLSDISQPKSVVLFYTMYGKVEAINLTGNKQTFDEIISSDIDLIYIQFADGRIMGYPGRIMRYPDEIKVGPVPRWDPKVN